jgi:hypothetical protein
MTYPQLNSPVFTIYEIEKQELSHVKLAAVARQRACVLSSANSGMSAAICGESEVADAAALME